GSEEIIAEAGEIARRFGDDEVGIICVGLVPEHAALDDVGGAAAAPVAAAMGHEDLAVLVVIEAPLVAAAFGEDFEFVANGMITPDAGAEFGSAIKIKIRSKIRIFDLIGGARFADAGVVEDALVSVEPAVGTPHEAVETFVGVLVAETIEEDLWF